MESSEMKRHNSLKVRLYADAIGMWLFLIWRGLKTAPYKMIGAV